MVLGLWHRETSLQWIQIFSWKKQCLKHKIIFLQRDHKNLILAWSVLTHSLLCSVSSFRKCCNSTCQRDLFLRILPIDKLSVVAESSLQCNMEVWNSKWFWSVEKGVMNLFLSISMVYDVISCRRNAKNTEIFKIAYFAT